MGKEAQLESVSDIDEYSWDEVRRHCKRDDKWIVIDNKVYNITEWARKHPGGSQIISHYAGQDASDAFNAFHTNMNYVRKFMKSVEIGRIASKDIIRGQDIVDDFRDLKKKAEAMNLFKPSVFFYICIVGHLIFFELLAYFIMSYYGNGWIPYLLALGCLTIVQAEAGWSQHDFGHLSVFKSNTLNRLFHIYVMNITKGASTSWWQHLHNQHHAKPNVINKDPDVRLEKLFVLGDEMPKRIAKERKKTVPYNWQHRYFFVVGPPLLFPVFFQYMVFKHPISRRNWLDVATMSLYYLKHFLLYTPLLGLWGASKFYFLIRCLESHWFVWVSQSNHIPMEIDEDKARPWLTLQLHATCDIEKSFFNDWFTGHLNFQIEHHLFPTMPRHNLYKIAPYVKELCRKHNVPYQCKTLMGAFGDIVRSLKHSGEIWFAYYHAYNLS